MTSLGLAAPAQIGGNDFGMAQHVRRRAIGDAPAEIEHRDVVGDLLDQVMS